VLAAFGGLAALLLLNVGPLGYTKKDMKIHGFKGDLLEIYPLVNLHSHGKSLLLVGTRPN
jgi:hypothetical protein